MSWQTRLMLLIVGALVAGQALHWFIGGASAAHTTPRNVMVGVQFVVGAAIVIWAWAASPRRV